MKTVRKVLALLLLTVVLCAASSAVAAESSYSDVPTDYWAYDVITKWSGDAGVLEGDGNGAFLPEQPLQLGELAAILSRSLGYTERTEIDVTPAWADEYVEKAVAAGVIEAASSIDASATLTRQEAIRYIAIAYGIKGIDDDTTFVDNDSIGEAYKSYVNAFQRLGYVIGKGSNNFDPTASYTRAEAMMVLDRISQPGIIGVSSIGFVDVDGTKLSAIAVEYNVDLTGAAVSADAFEIEMYVPTSMTNVVNYGNGEIGDITNVYINNKPDTSASGGSGTGNYVIIEVYTDYVRASEPAYLQALAAGVTQTATLKTNSTTIAPSTTQVSNSYAVENSSWDGSVTVNQTAYNGTFTVKGLDGYKLYTDTPGIYGADGPGLTVEDCFNEKNGLTYDYEMGYALWLPEDYSEDGTYALVTVDHTISEGSHPYEALLTNYGPSYFISDEAQQIVKDEHGLDGLIVVVPLIIERVDDNSCVPAMWMALVELWDYLVEEYNVDDNYIYGAGQSMGGMLLMQTNTNRDNYFAGMLCYGNQWGQNYYKDTVFARGMSNDSYVETAENTPRHYPSTADTSYIWDYHYDENGEKVYDDHDSYNFYYLISDDNLMVFNGSTNYLSYDVWSETNYLYSDLVGYSIPWLTGMDSYSDLEDQNQVIKDFLAAGNDYNGEEMGLWLCTWEGGANDATAIWSRRITAGYEWLLSQSRETEMSRSKLDLNKPFELADEQIQDESRTVIGFYDKETGEDIYFLTGKEGAGTQFYNTSWLQAGSNVPADANPGWLPDGMSWETGVEGAKIQSVTPILENGTLTAVAIEYNVNMENLVIHLVGDNVLDSDGNPRENDFVTIAPFDFYDADGNEIDCEITNVYVNSTASVMSGAERESGSGNYVIVELDSSSTASSVGVIQRTTLHTDTAIASATSKLYTSD